MYMCCQQIFYADNARFIIVEKGSEVVANLEKLNIPIKYFDKYAVTLLKNQNFLSQFVAELLHFQ